MQDLEIASLHTKIRILTSYDNQISNINVNEKVLSKIYMKKSSLIAEILAIENRVVNYTIKTSCPKLDHVTLLNTHVIIER